MTNTSLFAEEARDQALSTLLRAVERAERLRAYAGDSRYPSLDKAFEILHAEAVRAADKYIALAERAKETLR